MKPTIVNFLVGAIVALILLSLSIFVVDQRQTAIVLQLGELMRVETEPGLNWKVPLVQNVRFLIRVS